MIKQSLVLCGCVLFSTVSSAANCDAKGGLKFIGTTADLSRSVWLSGTSKGSFRLDAAQGNKAIDRWSKSRKGLRLSISPVVSNGNGGTHKLYEDGGKPCQLSSQNQKDGIILPPLTFPPEGITPERPGIGGAVPPLAVLPPTGITPERPGLGGAPVPPIGTLPPTGITPERPGLGGAPVPPIGTLPPTGITPERPGIGGAVPPIGTLPPTGITPERPGIGGAPVPPIGTLPPTGITPERPGIGGAPVPPIGTLPPTGITPERPGIGGAPVPPIGTLPPTGITPERPGIGGAPVPPIGTLPPAGITPERPGIGGAPVPPIGTLPPTGITPERPGGGGAPVPPIGTLPPDGKQVDRQNGASVMAANQSSNPCQAEFEKTDGDNARAVAELYGCQGVRPDEEAPLSKGRDLIAQTSWNIWMDMQTTDINDERHGRDVDGYSHTVAVGVDRLLSDNVIIGASINLESSGSDGFNSAWEVETEGYTLRPYIAYRYLPNWTLTTMLGLGWSNTEEDIVSLSGDFNVKRYSISVNAAGNYLLEDIVYRPMVSIFYGEDDADDYDLSGDVIGESIRLSLQGGKSHYGTVSFSQEFSMMRITDAGLRYFPYTLIDISYDFDRENDGDILSAELVYKDVSPWVGSINAGVRWLTGSGFQLEASVGYMSIGHSDLDEWQGRLYISNGF